MSTADDRVARRATWTAEVFRGGDHAEMEAADRRFWAAVPEGERATVAWQLSFELYSLAEQAVNEDFLDLLSALSDAEARYLIVGDYAVAMHGRPRIDGIDFAEAWPRRTKRRFGDQEHPLISLDGLITNKRAAGRPQDIADAEALEQISRCRC